VRDVSETAYLVSLCRALETEKPKALFQDPFARSLAGGKGALQQKMLGDIKAIANAIAVRTYIIDEIISQLIRVNGIDTVLNLGAGLDTRPYRLKLPSTLRWIEVDIPSILSYKEQKLEQEHPKCSLERVKLDLSDRTSRNILFTKINDESQQVLVLAEGILGYLTEAQVADLAMDLYQQPNFYWWMFDLTAKSLLEQLQHHQSQKIFRQYFTDGKTAFTFTPVQGIEFFRPYGWQLAEFRSTWEETRRLKRAHRCAGFQELLIRWFGKESWQEFRQKSGIVLLTRTAL
jgi:methyltransferase (TIGR00027 family)